jgi:general secretion pathway protein G
MRGSSGNSLMEMVVVLAILSLLATMAAPYATKSFKRDKEIQLRETLRNVRTAIDQFHADMDTVPADKKGASNSSANGYPVSLKVLIDGIEKSSENGERKRKRYLRSLPVNPFAPPGAPLETEWTFVGSQSEAPVVATSSYGTTLAEAQTNKKDIYDLHPKAAGTALDGTRYADW